MSSCLYRDPHVKDNATVLSLPWESPYLRKMIFILRWGPGFLCTISLVRWRPSRAAAPSNLAPNNMANSIWKSFHMDYLLPYNHSTIGPIIENVACLHDCGHFVQVLTHWCRVTYMRHWTGSPLVQIMAWRLFWTNAGILLIGPLGTNFSEILIEIHTFSFKEMHLKMSSGKWRRVKCTK